jgi:hypothetical protein
MSLACKLLAASLGQLQNVNAVNSSFATELSSKIAFSLNDHGKQKGLDKNTGKRFSRHDLALSLSPRSFSKRDQG